MRNVPSDWPQLADEELLELRLSDLPLVIEGTVLESRIAKLAAELESRGLVLPIHYYISSEWFTPEGTTSMAVPFYLVHPRLERLEKAQMLAVEGGDQEWCMRILRHEAGHVIDNAHKLRLRRRRRELFGPSSSEYPSSTIPSPTARASCSTWILGTRRRTPTRTSPRPSPYGSLRSRTGRSGTKAGPRSPSSSTWTS
jgi:hypothetical protein